MNIYKWDTNKQALIASDGVEITCHPQSGLLWLNKEEALIYAKAEEERETKEQTQINMSLDKSYAGHIVFTSTVVNENTGTVLQAPNPENEFSEMTITKNSVLKLVANIQSDKHDDSSILTDLPNDMFRIPIRNQDTTEQDLLLGTLDKGILTVEAAMDKAGYWEVTEALINSKLPDDFKLAMEKMVFAVVSVPKTPVIDATVSEPEIDESIDPESVVNTENPIPL